ncbi:ABC transporter permease [Flavihumibacter petaseus]|uniref:Putative ABC transporter permease protein n=1 Tax=Flavihumibacter petaseus NBRC 106054 TaxID=1220578 RepID=A0A0E9MWP6_9BACT|nr:ABC transporter permease [Flavihumibacter petaseus]GAO42172.1 putative ABC transporter permease protein [Flavihumibacter petaseus NBRC 106054]
MLTTWQKFSRQKLAVAGTGVIAVAVFIALFAYWLAPDPTPDANRMIVEIGGRKPGSEQLFLLLPKAVPPVAVSWWERTWNGRPDDVNYIPITAYRKAGDSVIVDRYIDEGISDRLAIPVSTFPKPAEEFVETRHFWLGTDKYGRDILSRLLVGIRASLLVGAIAMLISLTIGLMLGALAGYYGGRWDDAIMWFINVIWSIPTLLLVFAITFLLGKGFWQVFVAVGLTMWVNVARLVRGQMMQVKKMEYVEAARVLGYSDRRIILKHILPNMFGPVMVLAASNFASAMVIEAGLSFLGVGVQPPQPSWGGMIRENYNFIITNNPMLALVPGIAIMLLVLSFNLVGNGIRDALDVKS